MRPLAPQPVPPPPLSRAQAGHGVIVHLHEALASHASGGDGTSLRDGMSVRVQGVVRSFDPHAATLMIEQRGATLEVDVALLGDVPVHVGDLCQVLGELEVPACGSRRVRARIARNVNGLGLELWDRAVKAKRAFEALPLA